eukprot:2795346-Rhodomonas_salina.1
MVLCRCYALSGTDVDHAPKRCPVLTLAMDLCRCYACPVLTKFMLVPDWCYGASELRATSTRSISLDDCTCDVT